MPFSGSRSRALRSSGLASWSSSHVRAERARRSARTSELTPFANDVDADIDSRNRGNEWKRIRDRDARTDDDQQQKRQGRTGAVGQQPLGEVIDERRSLEELSWARRMHSYGVGERHVG